MWVFTSFKRRNGETVLTPHVNLWGQRLKVRAQAVCCSVGNVYLHHVSNLPEYLQVKKDLTVVSSGSIQEKQYNVRLFYACLNPKHFALFDAYFSHTRSFINFLNFSHSAWSVCSICHRAHLLSHVHRKENRISLHPFIRLSRHSYIHLRIHGLVKITLSLRKTLSCGGATATGDDSVCSHIPIRKLSRGPIFTNAHKHH